MGNAKHELGGRLSEIDCEVAELRRSLSATRTHGILYYFLLVAIILIGFAIGYATHSLVGAGIILVGLAIVAWREVISFRARTAIITQMLGEKLSERRQIEERQKEFDIEQ
ncbi:MAG TPA: hypothetical protein VJH03_10290 [Blastocatellia bacterium]|nr:hypothetical protein [Blastocatellia bacterium]